MLHFNSFLDFSSFLFAVFRLSSVSRRRYEMLPRVGEVVVRKYRIISQIGEGSYGTVFKAVDTDDISQVVAVKVMDRSSLGAYEVQALRRLRHAPNVVKYITTRLTPRRVIIVMEFAEKSLEELFLSKDCGFNMKNATKILYDILTALEFVHDSGFVHRDIKMDNIAVVFRDVVAVKLIDFGVAGLNMENEYVSSKPVDVPLNFFATCYETPHLRSGLPYNEHDDVTALFYLALDSAGFVYLTMGDDSTETMKKRVELERHPTKLLEGAELEHLAKFGALLAKQKEKKVIYRDLKEALLQNNVEYVSTSEFEMEPKKDDAEFENFM